MALLLKLETELESAISYLERMLPSKTFENSTTTDSSERMLTDGAKKMLKNSSVYETYKLETEKLLHIVDHFNILFKKLCHQCHR